MSQAESMTVWWLVGLIASLVIAALSGREVQYTLWGLVGPFGWIVAAIHGAEDRASRTNETVAADHEVPVAGPVAEPGAAPVADAVGYACRNCRAMLVRDRSTLGSRTPCENCGVNVIFGP